MSVIVYGPAGCGKSRNAEAFAKYFVTSRTVDDAQWPKTTEEWVKFKAGDELWLIRDEAPRHTISDPQGILGRGVVHFEAAMSLAGLKPGGGMAVLGYEKLALVLQRAYEQAASGKGKERHAQHNERFEHQVILEGARRFGVGALLFQAYKKSEESQRLPDDRAVAELLGSIVYLAAAVIRMEESSDAENPQ